MEWSIAVTRTATDPAEWIDSQEAEVVDRLFDLHDHLAEFSPAISFDDSNITMRLAFTGEDAIEAGRLAVEVTQKALSNVEGLLASWPVTQLEATEWTLFESQLDEPSVPAVVGVAELATMLGVSRQRASELARVDHFPKPFVELASGPIWLEPNVRDFVATWVRRPGRPRKTLEQH